MDLVQAREGFSLCPIMVSTTEQNCLEIPIKALPRVYWAVVSASTSTETEWQEFCAKRLAAECTACRIKIGGVELRQLATGQEQETDDPEDNVKLDRLRQGYCARNTCEGRFYRISIQPDSERHWASIRGQLQHTTPDVRETRAKKERKALFSGVGFPRIRATHWVVIAVASVVLFFVLRHWIYGSRIPVIQKKHEYRVIQSNE